jgi:hypothetical protein
VGQRCERVVELEERGLLREEPAEREEANGGERRQRC